MRIPAALERVIGALSRLPGVGEKTATRMAFTILRDSKSYAADFSDALAQLHNTIRHCECCHSIAESNICSICTDANRDQTLVCVVEGIPDLMAIEHTGEHRGLYHVLHGALSPVQGIGPDDLTISSLVERVQSEDFSEVVIATNVDVEGDATALYVSRLLKRFDALTVTRIATGVPMGGELEYLDHGTLASALRGRRPV
jgi:recombination protein RecR